MKKLEVLAIQHKTRDAEVLEYMLGAAGKDSFSLSRSSGYTRGLALLTKRNFDVVLFDLEFGDRGAVGFEHGLREKSPLVPIIVLVHVRQEDRAIEAVRSGAVQDYLVKERLTPDLLVRTIRNAVQRSRLVLESAGLRRDRERLREEIRQMAREDLLTGLPNRDLFMDRIALERDRANRMEKKLSVLALKLDGIHSVREDLGDESARILLREAASRIKSLLRKSDTVARTGADGFGIILPDIVRPLNVSEIARAIADAFRNPFFIRARDVRCTVSIGISIYPDDGGDIGTILDNADAALLRSLESGTDGYQFFDPSLTLEALDRRKLRDQIRRSVGSGQLAIYYQPLVDVPSRNIVCAEALVRWSHPERGLLAPGEFIPAAEEAGLIGVIDEWVLRAVMRRARSWLDAGLSPVCVTVNLSARRLHDPGLVRTIRTVLEETRVPAGCLYLEIAEKTAMSDIDRTGARLRELAGLGIHISIDDFGTGYSSLNHLERLPVERLKIDKSFIRRVPADPDHRTIVRSVTSLAHNMRMKVVAEGVETEDQMKFVRATGCDEMQGYFFSKPLPADEFTKLLARR